MKDYKNKYIRLNSWKVIWEKFGLDVFEVERRYKNCCILYGCYLKKWKSVLLGFGCIVVFILVEFFNLEWLNNYINYCVEIVINIVVVFSDSEEEGGDVVFDEVNVDE